MDLELLKIELVSLGDSLQQKPASQLSRLERSILSSRVLAFSKDSTQPVASFIEDTITSLSEWINNAALSDPNMEVNISECSPLILC